MNPKRQWVEYGRRSITTKAPFHVVKVNDRKFKVKDRDGITACTRVHKQAADRMCEKLNLKAAEAVLCEG